MRYTVNYATFKMLIANLGPPAASFVVYQLDLGDLTRVIRAGVMDPKAPAVVFDLSSDEPLETTFLTDYTQAVKVNLID